MQEQSIADSFIAFNKFPLISDLIFEISYKASSLVKGLSVNLPLSLILIQLIHH